MSETRKRKTATSEPEVCWAAKACPFCGWVPNIQPWHGGKPTKRRISCDADQCSVQPSVTGETRAQALRRWNKRVGGASNG